MFEKSKNLEIRSTSLDEDSISSKLRNFHTEHLESFGEGWNQHSLITMQRQTISRILYYDMLYRKIVGVPGCILEFGVQWGGTLAQLIALRGIYEPYHYTRHIYGFDTFEGFASSDQTLDGAHLTDGDYRVTKGYEAKLEEVLLLHEANCPLNHIKKFTLIKGDASDTAQEWADTNLHAVVAMAIFDMDIYKPTKAALEAVLPRLTKGSVLVFDEFNDARFPGETQAVADFLGLNNLRLRHYENQPNCAWAVWGE